VVCIIDGVCVHHFSFFQLLKETETGRCLAQIVEKCVKERERESQMVYIFIIIKSVKGRHIISIRVCVFLRDGGVNVNGKSCNTLVSKRC